MASGSYGVLIDGLGLRDRENPQDYINAVQFAAAVPRMLDPRATSNPGDAENQEADDENRPIAPCGIGCRSAM